MNINEGKSLSTESDPSARCPMCCQWDSEIYFENRRRVYRLCKTCALVFVPATFYPSADQEKDWYITHNNQPNSMHSRMFMLRILHPLRRYLDSGGCVLDFGCGLGPEPTLTAMLKELDYQTSMYDAFFAKDPSVFDQKYDFIAAIEVLEHLFQPMNELNRLWRALKPGGHLGIVTRMLVNQPSFVTWPYKEQSSRVCFYSKDCFLEIGKKFNSEPQFIGNDVILFSKSPHAAESLLQW